MCSWKINQYAWQWTWVDSSLIVLFAKPSIQWGFTIEYLPQASTSFWQPSEDHFQSSLGLYLHTYSIYRSGIIAMHLQAVNPNIIRTTSKCSRSFAVEKNQTPHLSWNCLQNWACQYQGIDFTQLRYKCSLEIPSPPPLAHLVAQESHKGKTYRFPHQSNLHFLTIATITTPWTSHTRKCSVLLQSIWLITSSWESFLKVQPNRPLLDQIPSNSTTYTSLILNDQPFAFPDDFVILILDGFTSVIFLYLIPICFYAPSMPFLDDMISNLHFRGRRRDHIYSW